LPALADLSIHQQVIEIKALKFALVELSGWSQLICPARSVPRLGEYNKLASAELRALN